MEAGWASVVLRLRQSKVSCSYSEWDQEEEVHKGAFLLSFFSQPDCKSTSSGKGMEGHVTV